MFGTVYEADLQIYGGAAGPRVGPAGAAWPVRWRPLLVQPKTAVCSVCRQYFPVQINKGEHGFDNQEMDMKPFFRAVGPAFHRSLEVGPFETVNIYPLMCHILGIRPEVNDGHLDATKHMLVSSGATSSLSSGEPQQPYR